MMEDQNCAQEFQEVYNAPKSPEDMKFDQIIMEMQQIVIDPHFENTLTNFMSQHWGTLDHPQQAQQIQLFQNYQQTIQQYLHTNIAKTIPDFQWQLFQALFESRKHLVDEQLLDTLLSLQDVEHFKAFIKDYRTAYEEVEIFKTIKTNKIPEQKKVKGKDNIFAGPGDNSMGLFDKGLKPNLPKKKQIPEKKEEELLVPELILTVKPIRKG